MWAELLPRLVGGTLCDHDAPMEPTEIVGYELTATYVTIKGKDFDFGGARQYTGISVDEDEPNLFHVHGYGISATVRGPR